MKTDTVNAVSLVSRRRLDAGYFLSSGMRAAERVESAKAKGVPFVTLGGKDGIARVWQPNRFKRVYASPSEKHLPYLRPYDVFEYLPAAADLLSVKRNKNIQNYVLTRGMILQSCSGRNLGPAVFADDYLAKFALSHDVIRIEVADEQLRNYTLAYLQSETGQQLLRQGKTGSVIDHISTDHVAELEMPLLPLKVRRAAARAMERAVKLREEARVKLDAALSAYEQLLPKPLRSQPTKLGWTINATKLLSRLDAASYDPFIADVRKHLIDAGGIPLSSVASVVKPAGRYKTYYVGREYGRPILSGTQILQAQLINLRFIAPRAFKDFTAYQLRKGWLVYQADGRAEETLGLPAMVTSDRHKWLASGHVGRIIARKGINAGWLFLAVRTWCVQVQIKALASGSVVDSTFPQDMESVILPPPMDVDGDAIQELWEDFAKARKAEDKAITMVEKALSS
ncbi:MAG: hypothetical protein M3416_01725 [Acidobacteriota bacterium]|nr:hypothetical protein [Acidobacteriota bacterium]